jgi:hypothetical protein
MQKNRFPLTLFSISLSLASTVFADAEKEMKPVSNTVQYSIDASFTYWYAKEDGLNVAQSALLEPSASTVLSTDGEVFQQSFSYSPGFKVGLGIEMTSSWDLHAEYTYFRSTNTTSKSAPSTSVDSSLGVWQVDNWFLQTTLLRDQPLTGTYLSSSWQLGMDLGDLMISRPFSEKKGFEFSPFGGLRTVWIRQSMNVSLTQAPTSIGGSSFLPTQPLQSNTTSHSWAIGPRIGVEGRYFLPQNLRLEGLFGASLLYTKFTTLKHREDPQSTLVSSSSIHTNMDNYNCVRPVLEAGLGLGWGTCFSEKYHFDLAASYDFSYFWGQNMMRNMLDQFSNGSSSGDNDLYFQGLTITAYFRF